MALFVVYWQSGRFRMQMLAIRISAIQQHFTFGPITYHFVYFCSFYQIYRKKLAGFEHVSSE